MNTIEELNALKNESEVSDAKLNDVVGGQGKYGPGTEIQWNNPLCENAAFRAEIFGNQFQGCDLYPQETKDLVKSLCAEFIQYVNTEQHFDLQMAQIVYLRIASLFYFSKSVVAEAGWQIFTRAFYAIFS